MTTVTPLPTPVPSRQDPSNFSTRADEFLSALPTFGTELNLVVGEVNTNASNASTSASTASTQAGISTTQAGIATNKAGEAATSAQRANDWANKTTGTVDGGEYSAKHYAQEAGLLTEKYQGALSSDPTLDKSGNPLEAGDWYINSSTGFIRAYTGIAWVQGISTVAGVTSINGEAGAVTNYVKTTGAQTISTKTLTSPRYTRDDDGSIAGGTWAINYNNGPLIKATVAAAITNITLSNLPASGTLGHLKLMLVNPGAFAITFPVAWKFIKSDFTTTNFAGLGITLPASGVCFFDLITDDAGSNVYVTISRN